MMNTVDDNFELPRNEYNMDNLSPEAFSKSFREETPANSNLISDLDEFPIQKSTPKFTAKTNELSDMKNDFENEQINVTHNSSISEQKIQFGTDLIESGTTKVDSIEASGKRDYDYDNLGPNAFPEDGIPEIVEEAPVVPLILSLPLGKREVIFDSTSDLGEETKDKESQLFEFQQNFPSEAKVLFSNGSTKFKLKSLNEIQNRLNEMKTCDQYVEPIFRAIEKMFSSTSIKVNNMLQVTIDIIRHITVKSRLITKAQLSIIFPFLVEKMSVNKLNSQISDLLLIISEAISPSFVLTQVLNALKKQRNEKLIENSLKILSKILSLFGVGSLNINNIIDPLISLLQDKSSSVKKLASSLYLYIYKAFGDTTIDTIVNRLPENIQQRIKSELTKVSELPEPSIQYYHRTNETDTKSLKEVREERESGTRVKIVTKELIEQGKLATKWVEQKSFLDTIIMLIDKSKDNICSSDLDPIIQILKEYLFDGNKNLTKGALSVLEKIAHASDKDVGRFVGTLAQPLVLNWADSRQQNRDQTTATINAFCKWTSISPFLKTIISLSNSQKFNSDSLRLIIAWIRDNVSGITNQDYEKLAPFLFTCAFDKISSTRQIAIQLLHNVKDIAPDAFNSGFNALNVTNQRDLQSQFDMKKSDTTIQEDIDNEIRGRAKAKEILKRAISRDDTFIKESSDRITLQDIQNKDSIKFTSQPTQAKKNKRLKQFTPKIGLHLLQSKQMLFSFIERLKFDAQILSANHQKALFSANFNDQFEVLKELQSLMQENDHLVYQCSDIFARWLVVKILEKSSKIIQEGISFLSLLYNDRNIVTIQEMECLIPVIFWCIDNKPQSIVDSILDLLFCLRTNSDPSEYSVVLRQCLDICSSSGLVHLFSELQFSVTDDPRNPQIFQELMEYANNKEIGVAAAAGGFLALLCKHMHDEERSNLFSTLNDEQIEYLSPFVPIEIFEDLDFENFGSLEQLDKSLLVHKLIHMFEHNSSQIQLQATIITESLANELVQREINMLVIRTVLFALHEVISRFQLPLYALQDALQNICFFANRFQRKIALLNGVPQIINSTLFKIFNKLPFTQIYDALLTAISKLKIIITEDSFYAKTWATVTTLLIDMTETTEQQQISEFLKNVNETKKFPQKDIRSSLINSVILTIKSGVAPKLSQTQVRSISHLSNSNKRFDGKDFQIPSSDKLVSRPSLSARAESKQTPKVTSKNKQTPKLEYKQEEVESRKSIVLTDYVQKKSFIELGTDNNFPKPPIDTTVDDSNGINELVISPLPKQSSLSVKVIPSCNQPRRHTDDVKISMPSSSSINISNDVNLSNGKQYVISTMKKDSLVEAFKFSDQNNIIQDNINIDQIKHKTRRVSVQSQKDSTSNETNNTIADTKNLLVGMEPSTNIEKSNNTATANNLRERLVRLKKRWG